MAKKTKAKRIAVLGAGSWGTTLALLLNDNGHEVVLWEFFTDLAKTIAKKRVNSKYLPGVRIPASVKVTSDLDLALCGCTHILFVTPSHTVRNVARMVQASDSFRKSMVIINASKGLEEKTLCRMSEVLGQELPQTRAR